MIRFGRWCWVGVWGVAGTACGSSDSSSDWSRDQAVTQDKQQDASVAPVTSQTTSPTTFSAIATNSTAPNAKPSSADDELSSRPAVSPVLTGDEDNEQQCGNGTVDPGEDCDDGAANSDTKVNACRKSCRKAACGDGVRDEGESCDTGAQNSDTKSDACRSDCTLPRCGDGVVDVARAEECDGTPECASRCIRAVCGDNLVQGEEECEPGVDTNCEAGCTFSAACSGSDDCLDDGDEAGPAEDPNDDPNDDSNETQEPDTQDATPEDEEVPNSDDGEDTDPPEEMNENGEVLFAFDTNNQGWVLYETSPESLAEETDVVYDANNGEATKGALKLFGPFEGADQKMEVQVTFQTPLDMRGRVVRARARLSSGLSLDNQNPGGIKLFAKTGDNYSYASGAFVALTEGFGWVEFVLDLDDPELVFEQEEFDPTKVRQLGVELRTFERTTQAVPATVYIDSVTY